jgi:hypothetical protein
MSYILKTLVRDTLVDNADIKKFFDATLTGSCRVNMADLQVPAGYPQILIRDVGGPTQPGLGTEHGMLFLRIEVGKVETGTIHPIITYDEIRASVLNLIDDKTLSATASCFWIHKGSETEGFDDETKVYFKDMAFDYVLKQDFTKP